jgi:uncharacterized protein (TIGR01370 family)
LLYLNRLARLLLAVAIAIGWAGHPAAQTLPAQPAVALFYGADPPLAELQAFDLVVIEPDHVDAARLPRKHTHWFAYVSVGEVQPSRSYFRDIPPAWLRGENTAWGSRPIDQTAPGWPEFFERRVIAPLWQQGYRGFFLDTLDAYHQFAADPRQKAAQEDALVALIERLHTRLPGIQLIFNRGFEILPRLKGKAMMVAAESLFLRYDAAAQRYGEVPAADREWLLAQLKRVQAEHGIPVLAIDYAPLAQRAAARAAAERIRALGFIPWVASGRLDTLGVGAVEVVPRRVALVTDRQPNVDFQVAPAVRFLSLPLHYLGYTIDVFDVADKLPERLADGSYAGVVTWFSQPVTTLNPDYAAWLQRQIDAGLRVVIMNRPGFAPGSELARALGFNVTAAPDSALSIVTRDPLIGFEAQPSLSGADVEPLALPGATTPLLSLRAADGTRIDAVALAPWGGFALAPFAFTAQEDGSNARWVIDPIEFLRRALRTDFPAPDVTTESGRRLLLVHVDGDGFASRAELPGTPFAPEVMLRELIQRYRIPHTISVIQGEIAGNGMFRDLSPALEAIARRIFAEPNVEIASHSYSHPFVWRALAGGVDRKRYERALNLNLPGYKFNLDAEIAGSAAYIDGQLAPSGKRTKVFLWTGDTVATTDAVLAADGAGLLNMNGGDTTATRSEPTLTQMAGLGLKRGRTLQVFAPNQNENVYTNLWTGPFYGYQRVIETFELTEVPRRLKPIDIYYHTYSASKQASLAALHRVYRWALAQPVVPVYASDYIRKVLDFHRMAIARDWRTPDTWRIRGAGELRTLRLAPRTTIALADSRNVAGFSDGLGGRYVHLTDGAAELRLGLTIGAPYVHDARGWIGDFARRRDGLSFTLNAYGDSSFALADARGCRARADGRDLTPLAGGDPALLRYELADHAIAAAPTPARVDIVCRP